MRGFFLMMAILWWMGSGAIAEDFPPAHEVLSMVRYGQEVSEVSLKGRLRKGDKELAIAMEQTKGLTKFTLGPASNGAVEVLELRLEDGGAILERQRGSKKERLGVEGRQEFIAGTDVSYEDLSMDFLYWKQAQVIDEERVKAQSTWKLRLYSPSKESLYHAVEVWVAKKSGALLKMKAYDFEGKKVKEFQVRSGQKVEGMWVLKTMRVESFEAGSSKVAGRSYLEF